MSALRLKTKLLAIDSAKVLATLSAGFNEKGDLVLEGYDSGNLVKQAWGSGDYEYWLAIKAADLPRLAQALATARGEGEPPHVDRDAWLVATLQTLFLPDATPLHFSSDSEFKTWLKELDIPSTFSSYS